MKKTAFYVIMAFVALSALVGCNKEVAKEPTFPQTQELTIAVGEQLDVTFTADAAWKLTIDANWLAFVDGEANVPQISGAAGEQTVTITTADVTDIFSEETAVVEITMGSKTQALCNITRVAEKRTAKMWIKEPAASEAAAGVVPTLAFNYDSTWKGVKSLSLTFTANFDWTVESYPEWLSADMISGTASETPDFSNNNYASVKNAYLANAQEGSIVIKDQNSEFTCSLPVTYTGMGDTDLIFTNAEGNEFWEVRFSYDGYLMKRTFDGYEATEAKEFNVNVIAKDYCWAAYNYEGGNWSECYWIKVYKTENGYKITTENAVASDYGDTYFFMIPKAMLSDGDYGTNDWDRDQIYYKWMSANKDKLVDESGNVNEAYAFKVTLEQKPASADGGGFLARLGDYMTNYEPIKFQNKYTYDPTMLMPMLPVDNTWCIEVSGSISHALMLAPKDFPNDWRPVYSTSDGGNVTLVEIVAQTGSWPEGQESKVFEQTWVYAPGDWNTSYPGASFSSEYFNEASGKCFVLFFKDAAEKENFKPSAAIEISKLQ